MNAVHARRGPRSTTVGGALGLGLLMVTSCGPSASRVARPSAVPLAARDSPASEVPVRISANLSGGQARLDRKFDGDAYEVSTHAGRETSSPDSCRALLPLLSDTTLEVEGSQNDYSAFWNQAVNCAALSRLARARPARVSLIRPLLSRDPRSWLPPELSLFEDRRQFASLRAAGERCASWAELDPNLITEGADDRRASLRNGVWTAEVRYEALADFTGDGYEDLILRFDVTADEGSYSDSSLLLLTLTEADRCVRVLERVH